ncbi:MAG: HAMP domain-containing sensor histidine kinase [Tissierellia bacterium]|nr:HAMP domain-containing sensor histidine kinase [Tissierellia bacterium]
MWLFAIFLRLCLLTEKLSLQNRVLKDAIEETATLGHPEIKSPLADEQTVDAIHALMGIRDNYVEAMDEKMKSEKMKTELITNISHDLKTPLTSIINYADILSKKDIMDDEAENYIRILGRNSQRLKALIIDLIDASKTGTGNVHIERGFIEFNELVSQIYGDFDTVYKNKNLEFVYESSSESIVLYSDGNLLSRTIQNLISNAWKYSLGNTRVYAKSEETEKTLYFSIKNISERKLNMSADELMEQFIRGEKSRNTDGSGLGLYIARNLIELLGGECRIVIDGDYFQVFLEIPKDMEK